MDADASAAPGATTEEFFPGGGEVSADLRRLDWTRSALGPPPTWPHSLVTAVRIMLTSRFPMWMAWGDDLTFLCNDAYRRDTLGVKYPWALGRPAREVWFEIWDDIGPRIDSVLRDGVATWDEALMLFLERAGYREETYHTFSYSPLVDDAGVRAGMLCVVAEETERMVGERRLATLRELASNLAVDETEADVHATVAATFARHCLDLPFVALVDGGTPDGRTVVTDGAVDADLVEAVIGEGPPPTEPFVVDLADLRSRGAVPTGGWDIAPHRAAVLPVSAALGTADESTSSCLVVGLNPYRPGEETLSFARLVAHQVAAAIGSARAFDAERRRTSELEALDRAKTEFFANVSHEFRTPLTLIAGPLAILQSRFDTADAPDVRRELDVIERNSVRLGRLVNSLLDFSRIQAGHTQATFQPVDLTTLTAELVGAFGAVVDHAGLELRTAIDDVSPPAYVDPGMWERIVLNLVSNAVKYTFEGSITVALTIDGRDVVLTVTDTGVGIPAADLPRVFDRFHRIEHARTRSTEGTGIGLALVAELVQLHGGTVTAASTPGAGTSFTVRIPLGRAHLPIDRVVETPERRALTAVEPFVTESLGWLDALPDTGPGTEPGPAAHPSHDAPIVLVVDDNADMRAYVRRVLAGGFRTVVAHDGGEALAAIERELPDLVVSDIMMPDVDGLELVRRIRADERFAELPVILLTAQAGANSELDSINVGADDYLVKPFSATDLIDRVNARLTASTDRRRRQRLAELSAHCLRAYEIADIAAVTHELLTEWFGVAHTSIATRDEDHRHVEFHHHPPFAAGISERYHRASIDAPVPACASIRTGEPVAVTDLADVERRFPAVVADYRRARVEATLAVPLLRAGGEPVGSLSANWSQPHATGDDKTQWFARVAAIVAEAIDRLGLVEREHRVLREFQEQLLSIDHRSTAAAVTARYRPAGRELLVGGDWYDVTTLEDGAIGVSIGDVVGKGLPAATVMAQLRSALGAAASTIRTPAAVVQAVDRYATHLPAALCSTLTYATLDADGLLTWSSAGHPPPLVQTDDDVRYLGDGRRPALAVALHGDGAAEAHAALPPTSLLLLYTDGLVERRGEELVVGSDRLTDAVRACAHLPLDELCEALLDHMQPDRGYGDDVALLALRVPGRSAHRYVQAVHATAPELRRTRAGFQAWLDDLGLASPARDDVVLAVSEALANACEHGGRFDSRAVISLEACVHDGDLRVAVSDHGDWDRDSTVSIQGGRGRGFAIMHATMDAVEILRRPIGTTVALRRRIDR